jgi:hypothetical protein
MLVKPFGICSVDETLGRLQDADGEQREDVRHVQKALVDMWVLSLSDILLHGARLGRHHALPSQALARPPVLAQRLQRPVLPLRTAASALPRGQLHHARPVPTGPLPHEMPRPAGHRVTTRRVTHLNTLPAVASLTLILSAISMAISKKLKLTLAPCAFWFKFPHALTPRLLHSYHQVTQNRTQSSSVTPLHNCVSDREKKRLRRTVKVAEAQKPGT